MYWAARWPCWRHFSCGPDREADGVAVVEFLGPRLRLGAPREDAGLTAEEQRARARLEAVGAPVVEADRGLVLVQDDAAVHAERALEDRVGATFRTSRGLLDVEPLAGRRVRTNIELLPRVHHEDEVLFAIDHHRLDHAAGAGRLTY